MKKILTLFFNSTTFLSSFNGSIAFWLLCQVKRTPLSPKGIAFLEKSIQEKITIDGYEATLYTFGSGEKSLIFLHGWTSNSQRWEAYIKRIDFNTYTCYLVDAPGHGQSSGKYLNLEIYRKFFVYLVNKIQKVDTVIGHSIGSLVIGYAHLVEPKLPIKKIVITGSPRGMEAIYDFFIKSMSINQKVIDNMDAFISNKITKIPARDIKMDAFFELTKKSILVIHDSEDRICPLGPIKKATLSKNNVNTLFTTGFGHNLKSSQVHVAVHNFILNNQLGDVNTTRI